MELAFTPKPMDSLKQVLREYVCREETADTIVPDSFPDVARILGANAVAVMRSKESRSGSVSISGGIRCHVMYVAEGETAPRCLEVYLPYTLQVDNPALTEQTQIQVRCHVKSADARMVNSRKIAVRVNVCCLICGYEPTQITIFDHEALPDQLQIHQVDYAFLQPVECSERSFQVMEEISLPANRPLCGVVYRYEPTVEVLEKRIAGNKAVFKGVVRLDILYATENGALSTHLAEIPFSQYCDLQDLYDEEEMKLLMEITGCDLERATLQDVEGLQLTLHLLAQCLISRKIPMTFCEDAYALNGELLPQWQEYQFLNRLDHDVISRTLRESKELPATDVVDVQMQLDMPRVNRKGDKAEIAVPICLHALYYDDQGQLQSVNHRTEVREELSLAEDAHCFVTALAGGAPTVLPTGNSLEFRCPILLDVECMAKEDYRSLCGGEIRQIEQKKAEKPAVVIRRTQGGERLWDIAKTHNSTVERIRRANHLESEQTENGILLIPT